MDLNDAAAALADVGRTKHKLAERARWPFHRHAMFGLSEGLLVAGIAQPMALGAGMIAAALSLVAVCMMDDRRRHGMFVSGWQPGATRPLMIVLSVFMVTMLAVSFVIRDGESVQPWAYLIGAITFAVCTAASLRWEAIYRAELDGEDPQ